MNFDKAIDALLEKPIAGLPLRMILLCSWHRIHWFFMFVGGVLYGVSKLFGFELLTKLGMLIAIPSCIFLGLFFVVAPSFLVISLVCRIGKPYDE